VPPVHIQSLKTVPDIDKHSISVDASVSNTDASCITLVKVFDNSRLVASAKSLQNSKVEVPMPADLKLWSPDSPFLYTMEVSLVRNGKTVDKVDSYVGMRKVSAKQDADGIYRMMLNINLCFSSVRLIKAGGPTDCIRHLRTRP
jgi:Beta-galactosidase/beta-glucuronidase